MRNTLKAINDIEFLHLLGMIPTQLCTDHFLILAHLCTLHASLWTIIHTNISKSRPCLSHMDRACHTGRGLLL